jgi:hypothetical protein
VFIVGSLRDNGGTPAEILAIAESRSGYLAQGGKARKNSATAFNESITLSSGKDVTNCLPASLYHHGTVVNQDVDSGHLVLFDPHRSDGVRIQGDTVNTLTSMMGTGGNNVPMVAYSMHGAMVGRNDEAGPKGSGFFGENEPSYTLTASSQARHGVVTVAESASMVRRLTPLECERLQGFPDYWTEGQTDGHRYKQLGNAVAVPVVNWIIERLVKITRETK